MIRPLIAVAFALSLASGCGGQQDVASDQDPCELLTSDQVAALTGGPTKAPLITSTGAGCSYAATGSGKVSLLVNYSAEFDRQAWDTERATAAKNNAPITELSGLGDEAFMYSAQNGTMHSAAARVGDQSVQVLLSGVGATAENAQAGLQDLLNRLHS